MNLLIHLVVGVVIAGILYSLNIVNEPKHLLVFIMIGLLVDADHLIYYFKLKFGEKKSFREVIETAKKSRKNMRAFFYIFHSPEFNALLFVSSFFSYLGAILFLGVFIHTSLDVFEHYNYHRNFEFIKKWSVIYNLLN